MRDPLAQSFGGGVPDAVDTSCATDEIAERGYLCDAPDLGIRRTRLSDTYWQRARRRYETAIGLSGVRGGLWLDCACGSGFGTQIIAEHADFAVGVDSDESTIHYAARFHGSSNVHFRVEDLMDLRLGWDDFLDVVISIETIEHVADCVPFVRSTYRLLRPGGVAVFTTPASKIGGGPNPANPYHLNELTEEQFESLLQGVFDDVYIHGEETVFTTGEHARQLFGVGRKAPTPPAKVPM